MEEKITMNLTGSVIPKVEKNKEEVEDISFNDDLLKEWTEDVEVKQDIKSCFEDASMQSEGDINRSESEKGVEKKAQNAIALRKIMLKENDAAISKLCQGATVSEKVTSLCTFKCPKCGKLLTSWSQLRKHTKVGSSCATSLHFSQVASLMPKVVCHRCKICSTLVLSDPIFMHRHLSAKHQMRSKQYIQKFCIDTSKTVAQGSYSESVIGNLCLYTCPDCKEQYNSWYKFNVHQRHTSCKKIIFKNRHKVMKSVYHKCLICYKTVVCEKWQLAKHMNKNHHGICLEEYCQRTGCVFQVTEDTHFLRSLKISDKMDNLCVFTCTICNTRFFSSNTFYSHRSKTGHNKNTYDSPTRYITKGCSYKCNICSKLILCDRKLIFNHMKDRHKTKLDLTNPTTRHLQYKQLRDAFLKVIPVSSNIPHTYTLPISEISMKERTSAIGNLCSYVCPTCDLKVFSNYAVLLQHFRAFHGKELKYSYKIVHTARYHSCLLCPSAVLSDRSFLRRHLKYRHKISLPKYEAVFHKHGGKTLPTFNVWLRKCQEEDKGTTDE